MDGTTCPDSLRTRFLELMPLEHLSREIHRCIISEKLFKEASKVEGPVLVHVITEKGKGYLPAERHPARFHGTEAFDVETGLPLVKRVKANYTDIFSTVMRKLGDRIGRAHV